MAHKLTLAQALDRFVILEDQSGSLVTSVEVEGDSSTYELCWNDEFGDTEEIVFDSTQVVDTFEWYVVATDFDGKQHTFRAYNIVNFDEMPSQG